jgi:5-methyltetrahydropteroyltriglutamate--homocysteine methyltransferase
MSERAATASNTVSRGVEQRAYRADHVGSFLRPPELLAAAEAHDPRLRALEDEAILRVLELQRDVGVDVYSDGEYRRTWFAGAWGEAVEGLVPAPPREFLLRGWRGESSELAAESLRAVATTGAVGEQVRQVRRFAGKECAFLRERAPGPFKITLTSAGTNALYWYRPGLTDAIYPSRRDLADELAGILRREVELLVEEGASYVQLDSLTYVVDLADPDNRARLAADGVDPDEVLGELIDADNASIAPAAAAGVTVGLHMCRGNNRSAWTAEGSYEPIAERAFSDLQVDRFLLEYDTDRAGGFDPLRFVPPGKTVVLGLISTKEPELESQDDLLRRIEEASQFVPVERLALSPQCGFASTARGNLLSWDDQRRKLELLVDTARKVWPM